MSQSNGNNQWHCWRCGEALTDGLLPYCLCVLCVDDVSEDDLQWLTDETNQPGKASWEMEPKYPGLRRRRS